jgi:DNA-binding transcriptional MerR regulator
MATYTIKDLEKISGIKAHTIRIWEKRYSIVTPQRTQTNIRYYTDSDLRRLLNLSILSNKGLRISKIALLSDDEINDKVMHLSQKSNDVQSMVESLIIAMIELDEYKFERILSNLIIKSGFEDAFVSVLYPFFERVGILWQTGTIMPGQEHFISNLVRQKLIVAIDSHREPGNAKSSFMLFLPEGELHELGILFYNYLLRKRGFRTIYLGQSVPSADVFALAETYKPDYLLSVVNTSVSEKKINDYLVQLSNQNTNTSIFIGGAQVSLLKNNLPSNVFKIQSPFDFIQRLELMK